MQTVHLRINDSVTGKPIPVRLRIATADGTALAPFGMPPTFPTGIHESVGTGLRIDRENWWAIDGACEIQLPIETPLRIRAVKGLEYMPLDETVVLGPGKMALRFVMERWTNESSRGWYSGDCRSHFIPPHAAILETAAEGLDFASLLIREYPAFSHDGHLYPLADNLAAFSGQEPALQRDGHIVAVNTLNIHPTLGRVGLLHTHRPTFPLSFGGEQCDDWSLCDWCNQGHRKQGVTVWVDPFQPSSGILGGESLVAAILGKIDAVEVDPKPRSYSLLPWYYRMLNAGLRLPLVGSSGKESNAVPLGAMRTYVQSGTASLSGWMDGIRSGKTYVTNGPILSFQVNDAGPGETIKDVAGPMKLVAQAESLAPFDRLELIANGHVISTTMPQRNESGRTIARVEYDWQPQESGWLVARVIGSTAQPVFAHSSPVYLDLTNRPQTNRQAHIPLLKKCLEDTRQWIETHGQFAEAKRRIHLLQMCENAMYQLNELGRSKSS
ncbi:MAG: CehA/McbA family metallohydrolase [Gemmataceae bacterium]